MSRPVPASVSSAQDLTGLLLEIKDYARWFSHESIKQRVSAGRASEAPPLSKAADELLRGCRTLNQATFDELITTLERYRASAPSITITLAAPPTSGVKTAIVEWCRKNIAPNVLINFQFNSTLLGGMVLRCGSRVFDLSFRRKILENRHRFGEVLRNV